MSSKILYSSKDSDVASDSFIEADITPTTKVIIFSGIACPELNIDDDDEDLVTEVIVKLGVYVETLDAWTAQVGLASIENDDSRFIFATDSYLLEVDKQSSELQLRVRTVVNGDKTSLHRFGYQVVAKLTKTASRIEGMIHVPQEILDLTNKTTAEIAPMFQVRAERIDPLDPPSPFPDVQLTPVAEGKIIDHAIVGEEALVKYIIDGCPFNTPLRVTVKLSTALEKLKADQVRGPDRIILTKFVPAMSGVDFVIVRLRLA